MNEDIYGKGTIFCISGWSYLVMYPQREQVPDSGTKAGKVCSSLIFLHLHVCALIQIYISASVLKKTKVSLWFRVG